MMTETAVIIIVVMSIVILASLAGIALLVIGLGQNIIGTLKRTEKDRLDLMAMTCTKKRLSCRETADDTLEIRADRLARKYDKERVLMDTKEMPDEPCDCGDVCPICDCAEDEQDETEAVEEVEEENVLAALSISETATMPENMTTSLCDAIPDEHKILAENVKASLSDATLAGLSDIHIKALKRAGAFPGIKYVGELADFGFKDNEVNDIKWASAGTGEDVTIIGTHPDHEPVIIKDGKIAFVKDNIYTRVADISVGEYAERPLPKADGLAMEIKSFNETFKPTKGDRAEGDIKATEADSKTREAAEIKNLEDKGQE